MAGHLLQLKLQSIRNGARRDSQHRGAWIGTLLFSILIAVFAVLAVVSMLDSDIEAKREGAIIVGSLAALDFLGFGLPPLTPSWGELLQQAQQFRWAWWLILFPSLALFTVMLLTTLIGEDLRDAFDPRQQTKME